MHQVAPVYCWACRLPWCLQWNLTHALSGKTQLQSFCAARTPSIHSEWDEFRKKELQIHETWLTNSQAKHSCCPFVLLRTNSFTVTIALFCAIRKSFSMNSGRNNCNSVKPDSYNLKQRTAVLFCQSYMIHLVHQQRLWYRIFGPVLNNQRRICEGKE